jgi:DNA-binding transcriptional LysR family regulator
MRKASRNDCSSVQINKLVEQGLIDVGIASATEDSPTLQFRALLSDPLGVVCSHSHPLTALGRSLTWDDLDGHSFIANGTCGQIRAPEFRAVLASSDMDVQNTTSLLALVAAGFGITTLPRLAVPVDREDVAFIPTSYASLQRTIAIITSAGRTLSPAAAAFVGGVEGAF